MPEYSIVNGRSQQMELYRCEITQLNLIATLLLPDNDLKSPVLPTFYCPAQRILS